MWMCVWSLSVFIDSPSNALKITVILWRYSPPISSLMFYLILVYFSWVSAHRYRQWDRQMTCMDKWMDTHELKAICGGKLEISAVCQQFWWVHGKADTAMGIRGLPSAYLSITVFPSIYLTDTLHLLSVKLSLCCQGQQGTGGMVKESWDISGKFSDPVIRSAPCLEENMGMVCPGGGIAPAGLSRSTLQSPQWTVNQ